MAGWAQTHASGQCQNGRLCAVPSLRLTQRRSTDSFARCPALVCRTALVCAHTGSRTAPDASHALALSVFSARRSCALHCECQRMEVRLFMFVCESHLSSRAACWCEWCAAAANTKKRCFFFSAFCWSRGQAMPGQHTHTTGHRGAMLGVAPAPDRAVRSCGQQRGSRASRCCRAS